MSDYVRERAKEYKAKHHGFFQEWRAFEKAGKGRDCFCHKPDDDPHVRWLAWLRARKSIRVLELFPYSERIRPEVRRLECSRSPKRCRGVK